MGRRHRQAHGDLRWIIAGFALALALVLAAGVALLVPRWIGDTPISPQHRAAPAATPTPDPSPVLLPAGDAGTPPTAAGLAAALAGPLADKRFGGRLSYSVVDAETGARLGGRNPTQLATPASVTKVVTAAAALAALGPGFRIITRVVAGAAPGDVVLVGGGDPTLSVSTRQAYPGAGRLDVLAAAVRKSYGGSVRRVLVDATAFSGATMGPGWDDDVVGGDVAPITAVMVDGGRLNPLRDKRTSTPDLAAGQALARLLGAPITAVARSKAPAGARLLATVSSAPISTLVEQMLGPSDNVLAEVLIRQVAIRRGVPADFGHSAAAVRATLVQIGIDVSGLRLVDGSGLSRLDGLSPALLTSVLVAASGAAHPELRPLLAGLPVAGFSGTLETRYQSPTSRSGAGVVRAKTGSLKGVNTLAGVLRDADGRLLAFALLADRVVAGFGAAVAALDRFTATLAGCGCRT